jgi:ribulose-phosphate 3-epimerase
LNISKIVYNNEMIEIIPAIMPEDFADLSNKVARVAGEVKWVQLDIMDGDFVPEKTWPYLGEIMDFKKLQREDLGLPMWEKINYEVDLMVSTPDRDAFEWISAGAARLILHVESHPNVLGIIQSIERDFGRSSESATAPEIGVAISNETPLEELDKYLPFIDFVQFMGIDQIGFQGEPFSNKVISRISEFHKAHSEITISVDGGVNDETAPLLIEAGAVRLVSGSYVYGAVDVREAIKNLKNNGSISA